MAAYLHLAEAPATSDGGHQVAADALVQVEQEGVFERALSEFAQRDGAFGTCDPLGEMRCERLVAQATEFGFEVTGSGMGGSSRSRIRFSSTGSPSIAIERAT